MKKIALIEDRYPRQQDFLEQTNINLEEYAEFLENFTEEKANTLLEQIRKDDFDLSDFEIIICHKSVQNNTEVLSNLKNYCKDNHKTLVLFSGGISVNYYDNSELELLELNSKTFYSQNLRLFLESLKSNNEDIMMLCYGEHWKQNIVANVLEKTNRLINKTVEPIVYIKFANFVDLVKLKKIDYEFYQIKIDNNYITIEEIEKLQESLQKYFHQFRTSSKQNKNLLIHHKDIADMEFDNSLEFITDDDIDTYITSNIIKELSKKDYDTIFIKDNLSSNYLELYGLRVAYHIRLSAELKDKRFTPIVIISDFDEATLNRFSKEAKILFTEGVYLCKNTKEDIEKFKSLELKSVSNYDKFLTDIEVSPPKDTSGTHAIANKWSIYRWAELLKIENSNAIDKNKEEIESQLYFKYLKALNQIKMNQTKKITKPSKKGKVLFIDDEWDKGLADILKTLLKTDGLDFSVFEYDFKDKPFSSIEETIDHKIKKFDPDVVILDLRLTQKDHENDVIAHYTGVKILQKIHETNAGIQVVMLTATSKSTILEQLYEKKILGYIKKEHPDDKSVSTVENINKFINLIDKGLERKYLKEVFSIQNKLLQLSLFPVNFSFDMQESDKKLLELKSTISMIFETLDSNIPKPFIYGMFTLYKCIEIICDYYIYEQYDSVSRKKRAYWKDSGTMIDNDGNASINNKIKNIITILQINENNNRHLIDELSCSRNYAIHSEDIKHACKVIFIQSPNETHLIPWFGLIERALIEMDNTIK